VAATERACEAVKEAERELDERTRMVRTCEGVVDDLRAEKDRKGSVRWPGQTVWHKERHEG
jgi:hypothetical protein